MMDTLLAYRPFLDPLYGGWNYWYLFLLPLAFLIALIYKAIRLDDLSALPWHTFTRFLKVIGAFIGCAALFWIIVLILERK